MQNPKTPQNKGFFGPDKRAGGREVWSLGAGAMRERAGETGRQGGASATPANTSPPSQFRANFETHWPAPMFSGLHALRERANFARHAIFSPLPDS